MASDRDGDDDGKAAPPPSADDVQLSSRLQDLGRRLESHRSDRAVAEQPKRSDGSGMAQALRLSSEFVAGVLVGAALGWGVDWLLGISPWGLIVFLLLGFVAGVVNVLRSAGLMRESRLPQPGSGGRRDAGGQDVREDGGR